MNEKRRRMMNDPALPTEIEEGWMDKYREANALPDRMSMLIYLTLDDVEAVEGMKGMEIEMGIWGNRLGKKHKCRMCAAGAVAMRTMKEFDPTEPEVDWSPLEGNGKWRKYGAIDYLRRGYASDAAEQLGLSRERYQKYDKKICYYDEGAARWKKEFREMADEMHRDGL